MFAGKNFRPFGPFRSLSFVVYLKPDSMSQYIDGFVLTIAKEKLAAYKKLAAKAAKIFKEHGALEYRECVGDDMNIEGMLPFPKLTKAKAEEVVIFAYVVYASKKTRDVANEKIMNDPRMATMCEASGGLFDPKRMAYGGFKTLVQL